MSKLQKDRQTNRQKDKQTERQTDRKTNRNTDNQTENGHEIEEIDRKKKILKDIQTNTTSLLTSPSSLRLGQRLTTKSSCPWINLPD